MARASLRTLRTEASIARLEGSGPTRAEVSTGTSSRPGGKSHSCDRPTNSARAPRAQTNSVADGKREAIRTGGRFPLLPIVVVRRVESRQRASLAAAFRTSGRRQLLVLALRLHLALVAGLLLRSDLDLARLVPARVEARTHLVAFLDLIQADPGTRYSRGDPDGLGPILRLDEEVAADQLLRLGKWTVGRRHLAPTHADGGRRSGGQQPISSPCATGKRARPNSRPAHRLRPPCIARQSRANAGMGRSHAKDDEGRAGLEAQQRVRARRARTPGTRLGSDPHQGWSVRSLPQRRHRERRRVSRPEPPADSWPRDSWARRERRRLRDGVAVGRTCGRRLAPVPP